MHEKRVLKNAEVINYMEIADLLGGTEHFF